MRSNYASHKNEKFYLTTAIAYASRKPHFGNTYEIIMSDAVARFRRQIGSDVFFCTGTDEHGEKIERQAKESGITPKQHVDSVSAEVKTIWDRMNASYDYFIRTTDENHVKAVSEIFRKMYDKGDIYKSSYEGWYCVSCESFFTDTQAADGKCPDCGGSVERRSEEAYFFRMSKYAPALIKHIEENPGFIEPEARKKEMLNNFLYPGLQDLCVSRSSFTWGIPVTFDDKHIIYVWLDALSNYITALGYDPSRAEQPERFNKYWPANVHIIGKDILRFHTIYWPIFLMSMDLPLPEKVFGHPWFNFGYEKMSKSKGNVIYADDMADKIGTDGVRYYALSEMPYAADGNITWESVVERYNTDLANILGNLVSRTISMTVKYFDGTVPAPAGEETETDKSLKACALLAVDAAYESMMTYHVADAVDAIFSALRRANKYIDETLPWSLAKGGEEERARLSSVIYNLLETIRISAVLLFPFMPESSEKIVSMLGTKNTDYDALETFGGLEVGSKVTQAPPLFARLDEQKFLDEVKAEREKNSGSQKASASAPHSEHEDKLPEITIDDFSSVELRTAQVLSCEKLPKAKKLLKLTLDLGYEKRTVVSGIAKWYSPDDLVGKKVIVVANLKPAKLCGEMSEGMILASGEDDVRVVFLGDDTPLGERIR
ncbi:MAG: methionine--tRNA ligase [Clostridia bacterium]|nr:methionine--tRNA ligase [Clostridia bacterium]